MDDGRRALVEVGESAGHVVQHRALQVHREERQWFGGAGRRLGFWGQQAMKASKQSLHDEPRYTRARKEIYPKELDDILMAEGGH